MPDEDRPQPTLQRAKTTITVPTDARDRTRGASSSNPGSPVRGRGESATRSPAPTRSASARRPAANTPPLTMPPAGMASRPSPQSGNTRKDSGNRATDFYDDYLDSYGGIEEAPPMPARATDRVANWARNNANPPPPNGVQRSKSMAPPSSYATSNPGSLRRKTTRRTNRPARSTYYEEEEEGYASGDYEEGPYELAKIRVKVRACGSTYHAPS